jgi:hypothetical protein
MYPKGKPCSEETKKKISQKLKGRIPWNKGKHLPKEMRKKLSEVLKGHGKGRYVSEETRKKLSEALKGNIPWNKGIRGYCTSWKGKHHSDEARQKISIQAKNRLSNPKNHPMYGRHLSDDTKRKIAKSISEISKRLWQNKEYREKTIKASIKGRWKRPTSLERAFIEAIKKYNLPYRYVGDGSFLIGWKNPDFIEVNGRKICIEVANTIHHDENWAKKRIEHFSNWGWKCLIFFGIRKNGVWQFDEAKLKELEAKL